MSLGTPEILVCLLIALLVLGPDKLPSAARQIGKALAEFKRITSDVQGQVQTFINEEPEKGQSPGGPADAATTTSAVALTKPEASNPVVGHAANAPDPAPAPASTPEPVPLQQHPGTDGFRLIDENPPVIPDPLAPDSSRQPESQIPWRTFEKGADDARE